MKVYTSPDLPMVGHVKNILESYGIPCTIQNQFSSAAVGDIPAIECWPELLVTDQNQIDKAINIVEEILKREHVNQTPWICQSCKEEIEGQFTACWNCGVDQNQKLQNISECHMEEL